MADLGRVLQGLRAADFLDIALTAFLLYFAFRGMQKKLHGRLLLLVASLAIVFVVAHVYQLQLISTLFRFGGLVFVFGFVIVFQEDVRRYFESLISEPFFGRRPVAPEFNVARLIMETLLYLSKEKTGALIVIEGRIPLNNLIRGGTLLDGVVSVPLLCSVFDTHSPGHDGAVILRGNRVRRFGVHLPLSRHLDQLPRGGTRHSAALGLTEVCDALVLCISEETGEMSYALNGTLNGCTPEQLLPVLQQQLHATLPIKESPSLKMKVMRNWPLKISSTAVAALLWLSTIAGTDSVQRTIEFSVALRNVPKDWTVESLTPKTLNLTLRGSSAAFAALPVKQTVFIDLRHLKSGKQRVALSDDNVELPDGLVVKHFDPAYVELTTYRLKPVEVPIAIDVRGAKNATAKYQLKTEPDSVRILVRDQNDQGPPIVMTHPIDFTLLAKQGSLESKLVLPKNAQFIGDQIPSVHIFLARTPAAQIPEGPKATEDPEGAPK